MANVTLAWVSCHQEVAALPFSVVDLSGQWRSQHSESKLRLLFFFAPPGLRPFLRLVGALVTLPASMVVVGSLAFSFLVVSRLIKPKKQNGSLSFLYFCGPFAVACSMIILGDSSSVWGLQCVTVFAVSFNSFPLGVCFVRLELSSFSFFFSPWCVFHCVML